jgi:predicted ATPase
MTGRDTMPAGLHPSPLSWGREAECSALEAALAAHRMVTVTGPGGVGKTRLALRVAQQAAAARRDGGWFVDLVQVTDPGMVVAAVAATIGIPERQGGSLEDAILTALGPSDALIVLDNCEHLIDAVRPFVEHVLAACPSLVVLATSRARLVTPFEWVYPVPGLSVSYDGGDAVTLFVDRAAAAGGEEILDSRREVAALCGALDGVALAIELAAARYPSLGLDGLHAGFEEGLRLLTSGARTPDRHRSMRDTLAWSFHLLTAGDQALLCGVSVFASWFDLGGATAIAGAALKRAEVAHGLGRLAEHNLLVAAPGQPTRYRALEIIRQFAAEQLARLGEGDVVQNRHREWCRDQLTALAGQPHDAAWCQRFDQVAADARAAIMRAADQADRAAGDLAERLAEQLLLRGYPAEAQRRFEQAAEHTAPGAGRARLLRLAAGAASCRMVGNDTLRLLHDAAAEALSLGDDAAAAEDLAWMSIYTREAPGIMARVPSPDEDEATLDQARTHASGSPTARAAIATATAFGLPATHPDALESATRAVQLARDASAPLVHSAALDQLCAYHLARAEYSYALETIRRRERVLDDIPLDASSAFHFNDFLLMASEVHLAVGNLARAGEYADRLAELACYREQDHLAVARRIKIDALAGDLDGAANRGERFLAAWESAGRPLASNLGSSTYAVAMVYGLLGDERSHLWSDITLTLVQSRGSQQWLDGCASGWAPTLDALVALDRNRPDLAIRRLSADVDDPEIWGVWNTALWRPWYAALWAEAAVLMGYPDAEIRLRRAGVATSENPIATAILHRAADLASGNIDALDAHARTFSALGCHYQEGRTDTLRAAG